MAKKLQGGMDEEEIIRRRDGVAGAASGEPLDSDAKRALADARLRALAFALGSEEGSSAKADLTDDAELLAYLLDTLPEHRRIALEKDLRGNARAFGRLATLRAAFSSETDKRDRQHADDPTRKIPRHTVGRFHIQRIGEILKFKDAPLRPLESRSVERQVFPSMLLSERAQIPPAAARFTSQERELPRLRLNPRTAVLFAAMLKRSMMDFHTVGHLVEEMESLLSSWHESIRREPFQMGNDKIASGEETEQLEERLLRSLGRLETMADDVKGKLARFASEIRDDIEPTQRAASLSVQRFSEYRSKALSDHFLPFDVDGWMDAVNVEAGPWALHLAGNAVPAPELAISLRRNQVGTPSVDPFLTLVRPAEGFETVDLDSSGNGKIALPAGDSVMLLQGNEVWEVRLSFLPSRTDGAAGNQAPRSLPTPQGASQFESLSLDIGRLMDRNLAASMWDRYQRGESKAFSKQLYTPAGQKAFDEIARKYRADRGFKQTVDRHIAEFERLLDEVARDERGPAMLRSRLITETGLVYTLLAHAAGRLG
jgi:hypothetical protein